MASKVFSAAVVGLDAQIIEVEADISYGLRSFDIVGLPARNALRSNAGRPDKAVEESSVIIKHSRYS